MKIGKHLACLDQSLFDVVRHLWIGYEENRLDSFGLGESFGQAAAKAILKDRLNLSRTENAIELPVFGNVGMRVHCGYKLFDLGLGEVVKVFAGEATPKEAETEISASRQAAKVSAAPRFLTQDAELGWYREEYIRGTHATDPAFRTDKTLDELYVGAERCLLQLIGSESTRSVDTSAHLTALADDGWRENWSDQSGESVERFAGYVDDLRDWLGEKLEDVPQLQLVLTHGDFSLVNAIDTNSGLRFIDWEGIAFGNVYSDILNFLFAEKYYDRIVSDFAVDVSRLIERFRDAVDEAHPDLAAATGLEPATARRLYYLERMHLMLRRKVTDNLCSVTNKSVDMFEAFDAEAGDT